MLSSPQHPKAAGARVSQDVGAVEAGLGPGTLEEGLSCPLVMRIISFISFISPALQQPGE